MLKHICCYSGGHTSAIVAIEVVRRFGRDSVVLLNHDITSRVEGLDIKRFKREVADYLGLPVTPCNAPNWDTKDQFDVVVEAGAFKVGNGTALCTNRMKTKPFEAWLKTNAVPGETVIYYGFDAHETSRIQRRSSYLGTLGYRTDYPVALWVERTIQGTEEIGIARPNSYDVFKHANCIGCLKAGMQHWYVVFSTRPDIWEKAKAAEDEIGYTIIKKKSLAELEPMFTRMRELGIPANEHVQAAGFWAQVRRKLGEVPVPPQPSIPCECAF